MGIKHNESGPTPLTHNAACCPLDCEPLKRCGACKISCAALLRTHCCTPEAHQNTLGGRGSILPYTHLHGLVPPDLAALPALGPRPVHVLPRHHALQQQRHQRLRTYLERAGGGAAVAALEKKLSLASCFPSNLHSGCSTDSTSSMDDAVDLSYRGSPSTRRARRQRHPPPPVPPPPSTS